MKVARHALVLLVSVATMGVAFEWETDFYLPEDGEYISTSIEVEYIPSGGSITLTVEYWRVMIILAEGVGKLLIDKANTGDFSTAEQYAGMYFPYDPDIFMWTIAQNRFARTTEPIGGVIFTRFEKRGHIALISYTTGDTVIVDLEPLEE